MPLLVFCTKVGSEGQARAPEVALDRLVFQMAEVAGARYGGLFTAMEKGYFAEEGLEVVLVPGGPSVNQVSRLISGRADLGDMDSVGFLREVAAGARLRVAGALLQRDDRVLMVTESSPVHGPEDLSGRTVHARADWGYLEYLRRAGPVSFSHAPMDTGHERLVYNADWIQEGRLSEDPYRLERRGQQVRCLPPWASGYDAMAALVGRAEVIDDRSEVVNRFLRALARGQKDYFEGDPLPAHRAILAWNKSATLDFLEWSRRQMIDHDLAACDKATGQEGGYVRTSAARIEQQIELAEASGFLTAGRIGLASVFNEAVYGEQASANLALATLER